MIGAAPPIPEVGLGTKLPPTTPPWMIEVEPNGWKVAVAQLVTGLFRTGIGGNGEPRSPVTAPVGVGLKFVVIFTSIPQLDCLTIPVEGPNVESPGIN